jgi:putative aldouronate transport system substrate-binding protein
MKRTSVKKAFAISLAAAITLSMTACGSTKKEATQGTPANNGSPGNYTKINYLAVGNGLFEEEKGTVIEEFAKKTGVFVQYNTVTDEKMGVLMASGNLDCDIIQIQGVYRQQLVEGGLLSPLEDLLGKYGQNIKKNAQRTLDFVGTTGSYGKNKIYYLPSHNFNNLDTLLKSDMYNVAIAPHIRYDYYKELGSPKIASEDDLLNVLKQMQDKHPKSSDGKSTYAMSVDLSAGLWSYLTMYSYCNGVESIASNYVNRTNDSKTIRNVLGDDFIIWRAANYYNKAHRLGILDPESFTQKAENWAEKNRNGQGFYAENSWNDFSRSLAKTVGPDAGFEPILTAFQHIYAGGYSSYGWGFTVGIPSTSKNAEAAMKWIDYLYTPEGARTMYSGVEGTNWKYDANKVPQLTEETMKMSSDKDFAKKTGIKKYHNQVGLDNVVLHPDGYPVDLFMMPNVLESQTQNVDKAYCTDNGVKFPYQVAKKLQGEGKAIIEWWCGDQGSLMPTLPDDLKRIVTKADDALLKGFPKMIMANSDQDFNKAKEDVKNQLKSMGIQQVIDWTTKEYAAAGAKLKK